VSCAGHAYALAHLSRWLELECLTPGELDSEQVAVFVAARHAAGYQRWRTVRSLHPMMDWLRGLGLVPVEDPPLAGFGRCGTGRYRRGWSLSVASASRRWSCACTGWPVPHRPGRQRAAGTGPDRPGGGHGVRAGHAEALRGQLDEAADLGPAVAIASVSDVVSMASLRVSLGFNPHVVNGG
jgi:hypothetical protein